MIGICEEVVPGPHLLPGTFGGVERPISLNPGSTRRFLEGGALSSRAMVQSLQARSARHSVFPWWTTVVALGLVLWLRGDGTGEVIGGPASTQLSWPQGAVAGERVNTKPSSSTPSSGSQVPAVEPIQSGSGASLGVPAPR